MRKPIIAALSLFASLAVGTAAQALPDPDLVCWEEDAYDRWHRVEVGRANGRLLAEVYVETDVTSRLLKREGVAQRAAPGREFDVIWVGRELKVHLSSKTGDGLLEIVKGSATQRVRLLCD